MRTFPTLWRALVDDWAQPGAEPRAWLMYSASYLMRTGDIRWAIDPVRLEHRLPGAPGVNCAADLAPLSFVLLTHQHGDHLDLPLLKALSHLPITWVVPEALLPRVVDEAGIPGKRVIVPGVRQLIDLSGIAITPFDGMHWEGPPDGPAGARRGVPAMGYLVEHAGNRWLFPGDTRAYDAQLLPCFGPVDMLFAHVWLGRAAALIDPPPLLEAFCRWCVDLRPGRIVLTHLDEFGRGPSGRWTMEHAAQVATRLRQLRADIDAVPLTMGQGIGLRLAGDPGPVKTLNVDAAKRPFSASASPGA